MLMHYKNRETGFSLLEVLIALIVLAVGLISVAKFQGTIIKSGSLAKARTVATHLAQEKLDDLRNYEVLITTDPTTFAIVGCNVAGKMRYYCIANNAGGALASGTSTVANVAYTRTWTVQDYYFAATAAGKTPNTAAVTNYAPAAPIIAPPYPDYKLVAVTVAWADQDGSAQSVVLSSVISAADPLYSGRILE